MNLTVILPAGGKDLNNIVVGVMHVFQDSSLYPIFAIFFILGLLITILRTMRGNPNAPTVTSLIFFFFSSFIVYQVFTQVKIDRFTIEDNLGYTSVIEDVPFGIGFPLYLSSSISNALVEVIEKNISPFSGSELYYSHGGFGRSIINARKMFEVYKHAMQTCVGPTLENFARDCITVYALTDEGKEKFQQFTQAGGISVQELFELAADYAKSVAGAAKPSTIYYQKSGDSCIPLQVSCDVAYYGGTGVKFDGTTMSVSGLKSYFFSKNGTWWNSAWKFIKKLEWHSNFFCHWSSYITFKKNFK